MWRRPGLVRAAIIGLAAGCAFDAAGCAFHANQAVPGDGPDLGGSDAPQGSGTGSGSGNGSGSGTGSGNGSGNGSGSGQGSGSGSGGLLMCPATYLLSDAGHPGSLYRKTTASSSWAAAEQDCEDDQVASVTGPTHLLVLDDQNEGVYAWSLNNSNQWLGATDIKTEGTWLPVTDQLGTFSGGASGNNASKNCLMTKDASGQTSADTCTTGHPYLCECDRYAPDPDNYEP